MGIKRKLKRPRSNKLERYKVKAGLLAVVAFFAFVTKRQVDAYSYKAGITNEKPLFMILEEVADKGFYEFTETEEEEKLTEQVTEPSDIPETEKSTEEVTELPTEQENELSTEAEKTKINNGEPNEGKVLLNTSDEIYSVNDIQEAINLAQEKGINEVAIRLPKEYTIRKGTTIPKGMKLYIDGMMSDVTIGYGCQNDEDYPFILSSGSEIHIRNVTFNIADSSFNTPAIVFGPEGENEDTEVSLTNVNSQSFLCDVVGVSKVSCVNSKLPNAKIFGSKNGSNIIVKESELYEVSARHQKPKNYVLIANSTVNYVGIDGGSAHISYSDLKQQYFSNCRVSHDINNVQTATKKGPELEI